MIYVFQLGHLPYVKVGYSESPSRRANELNAPLKLTSVATKDGSREDEGKLHKKLSRWRTRGEWYAATPAFIAKLSALFGCELVIVMPEQDVRLIDFFDRVNEDIIEVLEAEAARDLKRQVATLELKHRRELRQRDDTIRDLLERLQANPTAASDDDLSDEIRRTMAEAEAAVAKMEAYEDDEDEEPTLEERLHVVEQTLAALVSRSQGEDVPVAAPPQED